MECIIVICMGGGAEKLTKGEALLAYESAIDVLWAAE
jgi:hypothetical protein